MNGKGDRQRPTNKKRFDKNFVNIFSDKDSESKSLEVEEVSKRSKPFIKNKTVKLSTPVGGGETFVEKYLKSNEQDKK